MTETEIRSIARLIDHAVLHPTATLADTLAGAALARRHQIAALCVKPCFTAATAEALAGSGVATCAVTAFPHGNSAVRVKVAETLQAIDDGASEIDTVVNNGLVCAEDWAGVGAELGALAEATRARGVILKVIFETDYLTEARVARVTEICCEHRIAFVKTSTGFGYVKQANGDFNYLGATVPIVKKMIEVANGRCGVKASAGIRTLADLLRFRDLGCTRIGVGATEAILREAASSAAAPVVPEAKASSSAY
jgi:deoxyribose-phosphate aldolase